MSRSLLLFMCITCSSLDCWLFITCYWLYHNLHMAFSWVACDLVVSTCWCLTNDSIVLFIHSYGQVKNIEDIGSPNLSTCPTLLDIASFTTSAAVSDNIVYSSGPDQTCLTKIDENCDVVGSSFHSLISNIATCFIQTTRWVWNNSGHCDTQPGQACKSICFEFLSHFMQVRNDLLKTFH